MAGQLRYAIVDYPLIQSIENDTNVLQDNENITTITNDKKRCVISFVSGSAFNHKNYAIFTTAQSLLDFKSKDPESWDEDYKQVKPEMDAQGRQIVRRATSNKGWHYSAITGEVQTSTLDTYNKDFLGNDLGEVIVTLYNEEGEVITTQEEANTDCVKTVLTIQPDYDFEIIEGDIYQHTRPLVDVRLWTIAGIPDLIPYIGAAAVKTFVNGLNLRFMSPDDHIESDGRSSKFMKKETEIPGLGVFPSNKFQFILKHPAGYKHDLMVILELYKE